MAGFVPSDFQKDTEKSLAEFHVTFQTAKNAKGLFYALRVLSFASLRQKFKDMLAETGMALKKRCLELMPKTPNKKYN